MRNYLIAALIGAALALTILAGANVALAPPAVSAEQVQLVGARTSNCPARVGRNWRRVPRSMVGVRVDTVDHRTKRVTRCTLWNTRGGTTYLIWPNGNAVGTS